MFLEGAASHRGSFLSAALKAPLPTLGRRGERQLPRARRALVGWQRLCPGFSRPPLAWAVVRGVATWLLQRGIPLMGLWCVVGACLCLRPGESLAPRGMDFLPPTGQGAPTWSVHIRSRELGIQTKTRDFDDSVRWDVPEPQWVTQCFEKWRAAGDAKVWTFDSSDLAREFRRAAESLGAGDLAPCSMRRVGASWGAAVGRRSLAEVQKRGRWRSRRSVARHEKASQASKGVLKLRPDARRNMQCCDAGMQLVSSRAAQVPW
ncbi:unnamed protein product [Prorocentrum cordatum]|uniref:Uncharacterized protein n=1 Tax=Prorocentrum cordatum TaxID=2364126 RepID=A0ABN9V6Y3_9DINO|nr:unnamed protein product [Polarella glacialis]